MEKSQGKVESQDQMTPRKSLPLHAKVVWVLFTFVYDVNVVVVLLFWTALYKYVHIDFAAPSSHGIVFFLLLIDFSFHNIPVRVLHFIHTYCGAAIFVVFSVIYNFVTKQPIYPILNFREEPATSMAYVFGCFVIGTCAHLFYFFLHRVKHRLFCNACK